MISTNTLFQSFPVADTAIIKAKVLSWLQQFNTFCFLDSNLYQQENKIHEVLVGVGAQRRFSSSSFSALSQLQQFVNEKKSWLFGHLGYELTIDKQYRHPPKKDELQFPDVFFFEPEIILQIKPGLINISAQDAGEIYQSIYKTITKPASAFSISQLHSKISHKAYVAIIQSLQNHIHRGDCYEINFCQEFFAQHAGVNPFTLFKKLNAVSPNPFSALYHFDDQWLLCASPERFLQKKGNRLLSQPIKGTLPRKADSAIDLEKEQKILLQSEKDKAENVMVVDLVRNDLSRVCKQGSVKVDELFGIYSFPQVHQMISTISGELQADMDFSAIIHATFPMGSMTGAPKIRVMQLIEQYEKSKRGIFSGAVGYIDPNGDFDFNVVIRSLMYNAHAKYLSYQVGSGITAYSNAEKEWAECMIKGKAIKDILIS